MIFFPAFEDGMRTAGACQEGYSKAQSLRLSVPGCREIKPRTGESVKKCVAH